MAVTLVLRSDSSDSSITFDQPRVVIGRGEACDFRIPDPSVSHRHASIRQRGTELVVVDEGSTNGTFVGTTRLHPHSPATLRHGSMVRLGRVWLEIKLESAMPTAQSVQVTKDLALAMVAEAMRREGECMTARLVVIAGPDTGREVPLDEAGQSVVIGRGRDVHFPIDVDDASRRHARVLRRGDLALLRDLGSRNGTLVEGTAIAADRDTVLRPGDQFVICSDVFVYENPAVEALRQIEALDDELLDSDEWNAVPPPPSTVDIVAEPMPPSVDPPPPSEPKPVIRQAFPRNERRTSTQKKSGWGRTDLIVVFLALVVMVLSTVGMLWLFRT